MTHQIEYKDGYVEVRVAGSVSHWDLLKIVHNLHKEDPAKKIPDLWVLDPEVEFSMHSFPIMIRAILSLAGRLMNPGCNSAILAADAFQQAKVDFYCEEASVLPYKIRAFTNRYKALDWLQDEI